MIDPRDVVIRALAPLVLIVGITVPAIGQAPADSAGLEEPIDRLAAVVGRVAITYTQLQEEFYSRYSFQQRQPPSDPDQLRIEMRMVLDTLINDELIYQQAIKDTLIKVTPIEISDAVDLVMRNTRAQIPSEDAFQNELRAAGFLGIDDYRRWMREKQGRELFKTRFIEKLQAEGLLTPIEPTERELQSYYQRNITAMPDRPETFNIKQILVRPRPGDADLAESRRLADSLVIELRGGADFEVLARRFSQDPGSAPDGGSLGWQRRGVFVREFEEVAFTMPRGAISEPVRSPFGYHVIQVVRINPTERLVRHILLAPPVDSTGLAAARKVADDLRVLVVGGMSFDSLQSVHHDPAEAREARGVVADSSMHPAYRAAIEAADSRGVSPVFELTVDGQPLLSKFGFVLIDERYPAGPPPFDQLREVLRTSLGESMAQQRFITDLRDKTYIDIRDL